MKAYFLVATVCLSGCSALGGLGGYGCGSHINLSLSYQAEGGEAELSMEGVVFGRGAADLNFQLTGCTDDGCTLRSVSGEHPPALDGVVFAVRAPCPGCPRELWLPAVTAVWPDGTTSEIETPIALPPSVCDSELEATVLLPRETE